MTPTEQQIVIAEACGFVEIHEVKTVGGFLLEGLLQTTKGIWTLRAVPNYLTDLNAMHEAEKVLTDAQKLDYHRELYNLHVGLYGRTTDLAFQIACSDAAQRAEVILRTLNKWKD